MAKRFIFRRMLSGGIILGLYGLWIACVRLPAGLGLGRWAATSLCSVALFALCGMIIAGVVAAGGLLLSWPVPLPDRHRCRLAAVVETCVLAPLFFWLLFNEVVYATTGEVIGRETLLMVWYDMAATAQNAWTWGAKYLVFVAVMSVAAATTIYKLSRWSFSSYWMPAAAIANPSISVPTPQPLGARSHLRWASSMGALATVACLLTWELHSEPTAALTTLFRSAPPLRAMNLTRSLAEGLSDTGEPAAAGQPLLTDAEYRSQIVRGPKPPPNVILIVLESVSAKALHCYGYPRPDITPNMDALAAAGVQFDHCWSAASFSSYGYVSLTTSLPLLRGQYNDHFADSSFPFMSLPHALHLAGYETAMFSSGNEEFDHIDAFCKPSEFDHYVARNTSRLQHPDCMRMDDRFALGEFDTWINQRKSSRPFYCSFYLQSPHFNYEVPEPWYSHYKPVPSLFGNGDSIVKIAPETLPLLRNQYDNSMRYADHWVGKIVEDLKKTGGFDNSVIAIIGDHGEAFMEHGLARHGLHLWEEMIHVPLIVSMGSTVRERLSAEHAPRALPARVTDTVSGVDVTPTLAALAGLPPHPAWEGRNILAPGYTSRDRPVFSVLQLTRWQEAVCINGLKYIYDLTDAQPYLFDLTADPGERDNLCAARPQLAEAMRSLLGNWHTQQLAYYARRPFTTYAGQFQPAAGPIQKLHAASTQPAVAHNAAVN
jgi:arylsulfatase A-like enzyme